MFLILGVATALYWSVMFLGGGAAPLAAGACWVVLTIALCVYWYRRAVYEQRLMRINSQVTKGYVVLTLITFAVGVFVAPEEPTGGWAIALVALALATGVPPVYGAWRLLGRR
jgi:hypothetical protein